MTQLRTFALLGALATGAAAMPARTDAQAAGARPAAGAPARGSDAAATIDRASRAFKAARTIRATFEQTLNNPTTGSTATASGELALAQPNRLSVRFTQPSGDRVVSDGRNVWVYLPSAAPGQVVKLPAKGRGMVGVDLVGELLDNPRARYVASDAGAATISGRATHAVRLLPRQESAQLAEATVWVDDRDGAVRQVAMTDGNGLVRTLRMTSWTPNAKLPASTFVFTPPSGVRVVDQAALAGGI